MATSQEGGFKLPGAGPSVASRAFFFRALATLFDSGVHISRALKLLGEQVDDPRMAETSRALAARVEAGHNLSAAMQSHAGAFSTFQLRLVQVAEKTGSLGSVFNQLADYEEKQQATWMKARSALVYPSVLLVVCLGVVIFLPPFLFGGIFELIESIGLEPPLITKALLAISEVTRSPLFYVVLLALAAAAAVGVPAALRRPAVRLQATLMLLRVRGVGGALRMLAVSRFARALEVLTRVGFPALQGLRLAGEASANAVLEDRIERAEQALKAGESLADSLRHTQFFPPLFLQSVEVGIETGRLDRILRRMTDLYEVELEAAFDTLTALAEPLIMLLMGIIVGLTVTATMLPLMKVIQSL